MPSSAVSKISSANSVTTPMAVDLQNEAASSNTGKYHALQNRLNAFHQRQNAHNTALDLSFLDLFSLPAGVFNGIGHITRLNLSGNRLQTLPSEIADLACLTHLDLSQNAIGDLPDSLARLSQLEHLSLFSQKFADTPSASPLIKVPRCIAGLSQLKTLVLSDNDIRQLDPSLGALCKLEALNISNNKIVDVPMTFSGLCNLTSLSLVHNRLTIFPDFLEKLPSLKEIYLAENQISSLTILENPQNDWSILELENNRIDKLENVWKIAKDCKIFLCGNPIAETALGKRPSDYDELDRNVALKRQHEGIKIDSYESVMTSDL